MASETQAVVPDDSAPPLTGELRPVRTAFYFSRVAPVGVVFAVLTTILAVIVVASEPKGVTLVPVLGGALLVSTVGMAIALFLARAAYRKERYEFHEHRIVAHRGSLFSDSTSELTIRNITHVKRRLPWPRYPLFGVGDVLIESAGSGGSEIMLRTIRQPDKVYEGMMTLMRQNGFQMERGELLHEEQPAPLAVLLECVGMALAAVAATLLAGGAQMMEADWGDLFALSFSLLPLLGIFAIVFHYLDLRRRTYRVYDDVIMYEEGFLTRDDAFIPAQNIADSSTGRNFIDMVFNLYDVKISCQGSSGEIQFRRLRRGAELADAVDRVVAHHARLASQKETIGAGRGETGAARDADTESHTAALPGASQPPRPFSNQAASRPKIDPQDLWTEELKPSMVRSVIPSLVLLFVAFPLFPIWLGTLLQGLLTAFCTRYRIRENSVRRHYQFLHTDERDFSYDKITGAVIRENPLDRMFGTLTIHLWSIGSAQPMRLAHIDKKQMHLEPLLRQIGIPDAEMLEEISARFSIGRMMLATFPVQILVGVAALAICGLSVFLDAWFLTAALPLVLTYVGVVAYRRAYYQRNRIVVHRHFLECFEGWLWRKHYYARHDNIKRLELTVYPRSTSGTVAFVVAGEHRPGAKTKPSRKGQAAAKMEGQFGVSSYGFQVRYAEQMERYSWALDERLRGDEPAESRRAVEPEYETGPALANSLSALVFGSFILLPLVLLLPLTIPWLMWAIRRRRYLVEPRRVLVRSGIVYRRQKSILHDRIDSIQRQQQLFGKLFGNGTVTILTAGSSQPDLVLKNARDFRQLYEVLQTHYQD